MLILKNMSYAKAVLVKKDWKVCKSLQTKTYVLFQFYLVKIYNCVLNYIKFAQEPFS